MTQTSKVARMALSKDEQGKWLYGRRAIAKTLGIPEWKARKVIREVRTGSGGTFALTPEEVKIQTEEKELIKLPEIIVKVPKRKAKKPRTGLEHWVIGSDVHAPYQHKESLEVFYQVIDDLNPNRVILLGDLINLDLFSKYDKVPGSPTAWIEDVRSAGEILGTIKSITDADLDWISGNHEDRLKKYFMRHSPLFYDHLSMNKLFMLVDQDDKIEEWNYIPEAEVVEEDLNLVLAHGHKIRKHAGMSVFAHIDDLYMSVVIGHSHRLAIHSKSSGRSRYYNEQPIFGIECGCLCRFDLEYVGGKTANWQHGFAVIAIDRSEEKPRIEPSVVSISGGKGIFRGKTYTA